MPSGVKITRNNSQINDMKIKELKFDTLAAKRVVHGFSIDNKYLPAFFRALRQSNMTLEKLKMEYSSCADGTYRHFGDIRVTFSFTSNICNVPLHLFWLGRHYQDELINDKELKYDPFIRRPNFKY